MQSIQVKAMLTKRNLEILTFLLNYRGWISGDDLAAYFDLNRKTVQAEIRDIQYELKDSVCIETGKKGYYLDNITDEMRERLKEEWFVFGGNSSLSVRPSVMILYMMTMKGYVSMQQLADTFYLSKTAIALSIETVKRWIGRYDGLELEVSGNYGIRILGSELRKREYLAKFGSLHMVRSVPIDEDILEEYERLLRGSRKILSEWLYSTGRPVTGEGFRYLVRFLAMSMIRSECSDCLEDSDEKNVPELEPDFARLRDELCKNLAPFTDEEIRSFSNLLDQRCTLAVPPDSILETHYEIDTFLAAMEAKTAKLLNLTDDFSFPERKFVVDHIYKMTKRYEAGNVMINNYNYEISAKYPLEVYIVSRYQREIFDMPVTKETSLLSLFVASALERYKNQISVLLITDECGAVTYQIYEALCLIGDPALSRFESIPGYIYRADPSVAESYDVVLTTEAEIFVENPAFYNIPVIFNRRDRDYLQEFLRVKRDEIRGKRHASVQSRHPIKRLREEEKTLSELLFLPEAEIDAVLLEISDRTVCLVRIRSAGKDEMIHYEPKRPVNYNFHKITNLIYLDVREDNPDKVVLFECLSEYLTRLS